MTRLQVLKAILVGVLSVAYAVVVWNGLAEEILKKSEYVRSIEAQNAALRTALRACKQ